jgi:hypothetical protein
MAQRPSIRLHSGNHFYFDDPENSQYTLEDIAFNLCKEPRYNGATDGWLAYSVAQHAVNVSLIVPPEFAFEALHHDDGEAFYKDVTTHLKRMLPDYKRELKRGEDAIARRWGVPLEMSPEVKLGDLQALKVEKLALFKGYEHDEGFEHIRDIPTPPEIVELIDVGPMTSQHAYKRYLARHEELLNAR